ncbi:putative hemin transport protein [Roseovarius azorensis]|uniref:Putative hemin transport protein n=1 Tax=Roseovarius azorensis TaxID=1287727 RepID=A0A1H7NXJ3_9RHOB|nr:ChuX/HutX family heme-like substrate-binding protein [Roseovarius azorensis]SEL28272.1 putative hemin transport protein [Roseovarius azorensis]
MARTTPITSDAIRAFQADNPRMRTRDQADSLGISEAQLVAASCGRGATRIAAHPDQVMAAAQKLGKVMALTRNESCVHEKVGRYDNYHTGKHAAMILTEDIDLRIFPSHWHHAFMVEAETETGPRRSLQVFDAAGDAVHKILLRAESSLSAWDALRLSLAVPDQADTLAVAPRTPPEAAKSNPDKIEVLREEWRRMTDTHQFLRLTSKLRMNRLGAYRIAGAPFVRPLVPEAVNALLAQLAQDGTEVMVFVGNRGCIQIHSGPIVTLRPMGPWQNVMDPGFNLHLRLDHVAEVWAVDKPTQRGAAISVEAFDAQGALIFQIFGLGKEGRDSRAAFGRTVAVLPGLQDTAAEVAS